MVAVVRVDAELVDDLKGVFAPVTDIHQGVVQGGAVVSGEGVDFPERLGGGENIGGDDFVQQAREFGIGEFDAVQGFELLAKVALQRGAIADVLSILVFQALERADKAEFYGVLTDGGGGCLGKLVIVIGRGAHGRYLEQSRLRGNLNRERM